MRRLPAAIAAVSVAIPLAACSSAGPSPASSASTGVSVAVSAAATHSAPPCKLKTTFDYIERFVSPSTGAPMAIEIGNVNFAACQSSLLGFQADAGTARGDCTTIALASDNPGYDAGSDDPPPLRDVIESAGPGC